MGWQRVTYDLAQTHYILNLLPSLGLSLKTAPEGTLASIPIASRDGDNGFCVDQEEGGREGEKAMPDASVSSNAAGDTQTLWSL